MIARHSFQGRRRRSWGEPSCRSQAWHLGCQRLGGSHAHALRPGSLASPGSPVVDTRSTDPGPVPLGSTTACRQAEAMPQNRGGVCLPAHCIFTSCLFCVSFLCFCVLQCRPVKHVFCVFFLCLRVSVFRERFLFCLFCFCVFCLFEGVKHRKSTHKNTK